MNTGTCANCSRPAVVRPYAFALGRRTTLLGDDCAAALTKIGMSLTPIERRVAAVQVPEDRRRFVPAWIRNLTSRDETGRIAA